MIRPIAISLSPNTETDDIRLAWHTLAHPSRWRDQDILPHVSQQLAQLLPGQFISLTSSGRSALYMLLKAMGIQAGDEVILQAFTCIAVPEPILWCQAKPIYADILPRSYTLDMSDIAKKITPRTKAIIIQHTFGLAADIQAICDLAKRHNLKVIEDCAHSLGSRLDGQMLGSFGDAAIFSFGRDKSFSSVFGGAIATADQRLWQAIRSQEQSLLPAPSTWIAQQLLHPLIFSAALPWYGSIPIGQTMIKVSQQLGLLSRAVTASERRGGRPAHIGYTFSPALARLLQNQLAKFHYYTARRAGIAQRYCSALTSFGFNLPSVATGTSPAWLRFPVLVKNQRQFLRQAAQRHMYLGDWYDAPLVPNGCDLIKFQYQLGSCPQAEHAAAHVINLPAYPTLTDQQIDTVIEFTKAHAQPYYEAL